MWHHPPCLFSFSVQKREAPAGEKPEPVRTHLRNMIIVPEMIGSIIGVYNGKTFNQVEIKPEMIGHYLAEFSISYKPVKHGRPGIGATHSSRFIPLKWRENTICQPWSILWFSSCFMDIYFCLSISLFLAAFWLEFNFSKQWKIILMIQIHFLVFLFLFES